MQTFTDAACYIARQRERGQGSEGGGQARGGGRERDFDNGASCIVQTLQSFVKTRD